MNRNGRYRVLVVDDHPVVREGIALLLANHPHLTVCGDAGDVATAMEKIKTLEPHLVIVDISLMGPSGIELIKMVKARSPKTRMLVSSAHDEVLYAERALRAGAMGYVHKQEASRTLIHAMETVLDGRIYVSPTVSNRLLRQAMQGKTAEEVTPDETLSDRELEVLEMIGKGSSSREVAEALFLSVKTVQAYRERIKQKLGLRNAAELMRHAVEWHMRQQ